MPTPVAPWPVPPLSSGSSEAVTAYRAGVVALVAGLGVATAFLDDALASDPHFHLARVALAVRLVLDGGPYEAPPVTGFLSRGERQHAEVVAAHFAGDRARAVLLRREHLLEFPGDLLVVWLRP
jgi:DNA-binding GntR family transcriptional regulator